MKTETKWYVTVGVPGGEIAVKAQGEPAARGKLFSGKLKTWEFGGSPQVVFSQILLRPAPPELAEWLDTPKDDEANTLAYGVSRSKAPGGWLYVARAEAEGVHEICVSVSPTFVPVALASGITVLENDDAS